MKSERAFSTFHYHACAHAFSGRFTRPFDHLIDVQAASSLPIIGGHGNSRVENFQFREFVSFRKGSTSWTSLPLTASWRGCIQNILPANRKDSSPWWAANSKISKLPDARCMSNSTSTSSRIFEVSKKRRKPLINMQDFAK